MRKSLTLETTTNPIHDFVEHHRFRPRLNVPHVTQAFVHDGIADIREADDGHAFPKLLAHERDVCAIKQRTGQHEHVRTRTPKVATYIVHRRDRHGRDSQRFERRVQTHRWLDVGHQYGDHAGLILFRTPAPHHSGAWPFAHAFPTRL